MKLGGGKGRFLHLATARLLTEGGTPGKNSHASRAILLHNESLTPDVVREQCFQDVTRHINQLRKEGGAFLNWDANADFRAND